MDMDIDLDLASADEAEAFDTWGITTDDNDDLLTASQATNDMMSQPQPNKVNVEGVDTLTTAQLKAYAVTHFSAEKYVRIEWIDDSHANLVYEDNRAALSALARLTDTSKYDADFLTDEALRQREARPFVNDGINIPLRIRLAVTTDVKAPNAHDASRFYLMNPDKDPRERRNKQWNTRRGDSDDGSERRRYNNREQRRRGSIVEYNVDMYDDPAYPRPRQARGHDRRGSPSDDMLDSRMKGRRKDMQSLNLNDILSTKPYGRLRDRSASPLSDGDGRYGFDESKSVQQHQIRTRSCSPQYNRKARVELFPRHDRAIKELFPGMTSRSTVLSSATAPKPSPNSNANKELFPGKDIHKHSNCSGELLPHNTARGNHGRQDAYAFRDKKAGLTKLCGLQECNVADPDDSLINEGDLGFGIRGSAHSLGFSIRGAAEVRELFPTKASPISNAGKELYSERVQGRGNPLRKA